MSIRHHGKVNVPRETVEYAEDIKRENYKTNTPSKFQIRTLRGCERLMNDLAAMIGVPRGHLDFVYFSCCKGAEPHTDQLNPEKFEDTTYVIPVILPTGKSVIVADGVEAEVELGGVYQFDHTKTHSMHLEDNESGCVVVMVAVRKRGP